jgi:hypothetical protein
MSNDRLALKKEKYRNKAWKVLAFSKVDRGLSQSVSDVDEVEVVTQSITGASVTTAAGRWWVFNPILPDKRELTTIPWMNQDLDVWVDVHTNFTVKLHNNNVIPLTVRVWTVTFLRDFISKHTVTGSTSSTESYLSRPWAAMGGSINDIFNNDHFDPRMIPQISDWADIRYYGGGVIRPADGKIIFDKKFRLQYTRGSCLTFNQEYGIIDPTAGTTVYCNEGNVALLVHIMPPVVSGATSSGFPGFTRIAEVQTTTKGFVGVDSNFAASWIPTVDEPTSVGTAVAIGRDAVSITYGPGNPTI